MQGIRAHGRRTLVLSIAASLTGLVATSSAGAATQLGQVATADPPGCGMGDYLQSTIASGTSYVVPAGGGVITMWQSRGRGTFTGSGRLQVWRAAPGGGFTLVGRSAVETFTANMAPLYSTQIPVVAGDTIGLRLNLDQSGCKFSTGDNGDVFLLDPAPDPAVGDTLSFNTGEPMSRVNVAATLEPDADCDGLGDESQDPSIDPSGCNPPAPPPADGGGGDATAPDTQITKGPKDKTKKKSATFEFTGTDARAVAGFQCSLDGGAFAACTSPHAVKVKKGKHTFQVRAIDQAGNVGSAASDSWKVKKKKRR